MLKKFNAPSFDTMALLSHPLHFCVIHSWCGFLYFIGLTPMYFLVNNNNSDILLGKISITLDTDWKEPRDANDPSHVAAAERALLFKLGWYAHPIFLTGDYPQLMKDVVANKSALRGLNHSRLPEFTEEEKKRILGILMI